MEKTAYYKFMFEHIGGEEADCGGWTVLPSFKLKCQSRGRITLMLLISSSLLYYGIKNKKSSKQIIGLTLGGAIIGVVAHSILSDYYGKTYLQDNSKKPIPIAS